MKICLLSPGGEVNVVGLLSQMSVDVFAVADPYNDHEEDFISDLVNDAIVT